MTATDARAMFDRLVRLQRSLPSPPPMLEPFEVRPADVVNLQAAARHLARHVGLGELTFIVAMTTQPPDVAGHVEIKYAQREVFIEISEQLVEFPRAVLATLAHEVTHKYLHAHGIWLDDLLENERLTDTAAVFNGLGLLLLDGCVDEVRTRVGDTEYVRHFKGGYLDRDALAAVYVAVQHSRGEAADPRTLNDGAAAAVKAARRPVMKWLGGRLKGRTSGETLAKALTDQARDEQRLLAAAARDLRHLEEAVLPAVRAQIKARHAALRLNQDEIARLASAPDDPLMQARARAMTAELGERCEGSTRQMRAALQSAVGAIDPTGEHAIEASRVLVCGACDGKLRLPAGKADVVASCPRCAYRFSADTTAGGPVDPKRKGWRGWLG